MVVNSDVAARGGVWWRVVAEWWWALGGARCAGGAGAGCEVHCSADLLRDVNRIT